MADEIFRFLSHMGLERTDKGFYLEAGFVFPPDFLGFQGHFPGEPVLPAMVQLFLVRLLAERALGGPLFARCLDRAKFKDLVRPEEKITIHLDGQESGQDSWSVDFKISREDETVAIGEIILDRLSG